MTKIIIILAILLFPIQAMCAGRSLTFDCTPAVDAVTSAKLYFNALPSVDAPLVSTCGSGADKVTCTDPASKTICYPDTLWPTTAFTAKATVTNARDTSGQSLPLSVPGVPSSPSLLRAITQ